MHLKRFLTADQQRELYEGIAEAAQTYSATRARNPRSNFTKIMYYNCSCIPVQLMIRLMMTVMMMVMCAGKSHKHLIPSSFMYFSAAACATASDVSPCIPPTYRPDYATSFSYSDEDGRLTGHVDKVSSLLDEGTRAQLERYQTRLLHDAGDRLGRPLLSRMHGTLLREGSEDAATRRCFPALIICEPLCFFFEEV